MRYNFYLISKLHTVQFLPNLRLPSISPKKWRQSSTLELESLEVDTHLDPRIRVSWHCRLSIATFTTPCPYHLDRPRFSYFLLGLSLMPTVLIVGARTTVATALMRRALARRVVTAVTGGVMRAGRADSGVCRCGSQAHGEPGQRRDDRNFGEHRFPLRNVEF